MLSFFYAVVVVTLFALSGAVFKHDARYFIGKSVYGVLWTSTSIPAFLMAYYYLTGSQQASFNNWAFSFLGMLLACTAVHAAYRYRDYRRTKQHAVTLEPSDDNNLTVSHDPYAVPPNEEEVFPQYKRPEPF